MSRVLRLLRQRPTPTQIRTLSTNSPPAPNEVRQSRIEKARIKSLLHTLTRYINSNHTDQLPTYLKIKLAQPETHNRSRPFLFETLIGFLVERKLLSQANRLYERMLQEEMVPSLFLRVKMESIAIAHSRKTRQAVFTELQPLFAQSVFDDTSLRELIATLDQGVRQQYNAETIEKLVKVYIDAQGSDYTPSFELVCSLVDLLARNSKPKLADKWVEAYKEMEGKASQADSSPPSPSKAKAKSRSADLYSTYLSSLTAPTLKKHSNISNQLLKKMSEDGIQPTTEIFNNLIQTQLLRGQLERVFLLYGVLTAWKEERRVGLYPDGMTFVLMFRAVKLARAPRGVKSRKHRTHATSSEVKIPTPRELFSDMLLTHNTLTTLNTRFPASTATTATPTQISTPLKTSTIQLALRSFLLSHDYPAAYIALRSLTYLPHEGSGSTPEKSKRYRRYDGKGADLGTWKIVVKGMLRRAYFELGRKGDGGGGRWVDHLLGQETDLPLNQGLTGDIVVQILRFGLDPRITLGPSPDPEDLVGYEDIPDIGLLLNDDPDLDEAGNKVTIDTSQEGWMDWGKRKIWGDPAGPKDWIYGRIPLERILRKGILAQVLVEEASSASSSSTLSPPADEVEAEEGTGEVGAEGEDEGKIEVEEKESKKVSRLIADAKLEMIKSIPHWVKEEGKGERR